MNLRPARFHALLRPRVEASRQSGEDRAVRTVLSATERKRMRRLAWRDSRMGCRKTPHDGDIAVSVLGVAGRNKCRRTETGRGTASTVMLWVAAAVLTCFAVTLTGAQQPARRTFRIGVLNAAWAATHPTVEGLKAGLKELGLQDGRDVTFDIRFTEGKLDAMPAAADALVKSGVDLIFTSQEAAAQAARRATTTVPIVFTLVGDPVGARIVEKLAQPGGK